MFRDEQVPGTETETWKARAIATTAATLLELDLPGLATGAIARVDTRQQF